MSTTADARLNTYEEASRSAADAVRNSADYLRRMRTLRQQEAVSQVAAELRKRAPTGRGRADRVWLAWASIALICAVLALTVSAIGLFG